MLISSQRFLDDDVVAEKMENKDYNVFVTPEFEIDGETVQAIIDGHHSYAAAKAAGVKPNIIEQTATDNDTINLINCGEIELFLEVAYHDSAWYNIETGSDIF